MRVPTIALLAATLLVTAACDQRGFSGMQDEWDRRRAQQFFVISASSEAAVISALGEEVAIRPAEGFCLSRESIETSDRSAVALIGDCALEADVENASRSERGELNLPRSLPGIITVSISGNPEVRSSGLDADRIEEFLQSKQGKGLIGRSSDGSGVKIQESRRSDDVVFLLIEDTNAGSVPIFSDTFWRAFMTLNDRLAVITINGFRASPIGVESMLAHLTEQVAVLKAANVNGVEDTHSLIARSEPLDAERIASGDGADVTPDTGETTASLRDLRPTSIVISTTGTSEEAQAAAAVAPEAREVPEPVQSDAAEVTVAGGPTIVPRSRPNTGVSVVDSSEPDEASGLAPVSAPAAPRRRKRS